MAGLRGVPFGLWLNFRCEVRLRGESNWLFLAVVLGCGLGHRDVYITRGEGDKFRSAKVVLRVKASISFSDWG